MMTAQSLFRPRGQAFKKNVNFLAKNPANNSHPNQTKQLFFKPKPASQLVIQPG